jgi:hypothetical protein
MIYASMPEQVKRPNPWIIIIIIIIIIYALHDVKKYLIIGSFTLYN